jgi:hypothetical protein
LSSMIPLNQFCNLLLKKWILLLIGLFLGSFFNSSHWQHTKGNSLGQRSLILRFIKIWHRLGIYRVRPIFDFSNSILTVRTESGLTGTVDIRKHMMFVHQIGSGDAWITIISFGSEFDFLVVLMIIELV